MNSDEKSGNGRHIDLFAIREGYATALISKAKNRKSQIAFTLVELLVMLGIFVVLLAIFIPYVASLRESDARVRCSDNLKLLRNALATYAGDSNGAFPRVRYDAEHRPDTYTAFTGIDDGDPFGEDTEVQPNDVSASLWLLLRNNLAMRKHFICPGTWDTRDPQTDEHGRPTSLKRRSNFRSGSNLSYSYASPFSSALQYSLNADRLDWGFALMADKNPGAAAASVSVHSRPLERAKGNSPNHNGAGQNVLYSDGHVEWRTTPYAGFKSDNIYTTLWPRPLEPGQQPPPDSNGFTGKNVGPSWAIDSYLVPSAEDD